MPRPSPDPKLPLSLSRLESWLQAEIVRPHEGGASLLAVEAAVLPSRSLAPKERVAIYSDMYFSRLLDCLREDYPAVLKLAGRGTFEKLARDYLARHPSRHYSLNFLGRKLPEFLDGAARIQRHALLADVARSPASTGSSSTRPIQRHALLADVARVECAMSESFEAPASPVLGPAELALVPPSAWEKGRIRLAESLRLLELGHRANAIVTACRQGKPVPQLARKKTWIAVYRKEWTVWRMDLTRPMHAVLASLRDEGSLASALAAGARSFEGSPEKLQTEVHRWFREWASEGLFAEVQAVRPSG